MYMGLGYNLSGSSPSRAKKDHENHHPHGERRVTVIGLALFGHSQPRRQPSPNGALDVYQHHEGGETNRVHNVQ